MSQCEQVCNALPECKKPAHIQGACSTHGRQIKLGKPLTMPYVKPRNEVCDALPDCGRPALHCGLCERHNFPCDEPDLLSR